MEDYNYLEKLSELKPFIIGAHVILLEILFLVFPVIANTLVPWYGKSLLQLLVIFICSIDPSKS